MDKGKVSPKSEARRGSVSALEELEQASRAIFQKNLKNKAGRYRNKQARHLKLIFDEMDQQCQGEMNFNDMWNTVKDVNKFAELKQIAHAFQLRSRETKTVDKLNASHFTFDEFCSLMLPDHRERARTLETLNMREPDAADVWDFQVLFDLHATHSEVHLPKCNMATMWHHLQNHHALSHFTRFSHPAMLNPVLREEMVNCEALLRLTFTPTHKSKIQEIVDMLMPADNADFAALLEDSWRKLEPEDMLDDEEVVVLETWINSEFIKSINLTHADSVWWFRCLDQGNKQAITKREFRIFVRLQQSKLSTKRLYEILGHNARARLTHAR